MTYLSKIDWWLGLLFLAMTLMNFGIGGVMLYAVVVQVAPVPVLLQTPFFPDWQFSRPHEDVGEGF